MDPQRLHTALAALETETTGRIAVEAVDLRTDQRFTLRHTDVVQTASTMKLCILCELFNRAQQGQLNLDEQLTWDRSLLRDGDGVLRAMRLGQSLSLYNLAVLMMIVSDNVATATLVKRLGPQNITNTMHAWGFADTDIFEGLPGGENGENMTQPVSTAHDMCTLIERIARHQILTPDACREIITILRAQRCNDMMPRHIPVGEDWGAAPMWIANKTGYGRCRVEVGIVNHPQAHFALALFYEPLKSYEALTKGLADYPPVIAAGRACRLVFDAFASDAKSAD